MCEKQDCTPACTGQKLHKFYFRIAEGRIEVNNRSFNAFLLTITVFRIPLREANGADDVSGVIIIKGSDKTQSNTKEILSKKELFPDKENSVPYHRSMEEMYREMEQKLIHKNKLIDILLAEKVCFILFLYFFYLFTFFTAVSAGIASKAEPTKILSRNWSA